ncbi:hypothetical protein [Serratia fonticola]|uniref:hypothetical protein n=1 Tax=Serratia fonticola TaxID=47917 RepID=UPI0034C6777E
MRNPQRYQLAAQIWAAFFYLKFKGKTSMAQAIGGAIGVVKTLLERILQNIIAGAKPGPEAYA